MDVSTIVLVLLAAAGIWLIAELAITVRRARAAVDSAQEVIKAAGPAIDDIDEVAKAIKPAVEHIDAVVTQAGPAVDNLDPLLNGTTVAVNALSEDLRRLDAILEDVSRISGTAGNATAAVGDAASALAGRAKTFLARPRGANRARIAPAPAAPAPARSLEPVSAPGGQVDPYGSGVLGDAAPLGGEVPGPGGAADGHEAPVEPADTSEPVAQVGDVLPEVVSGDPGYFTYPSSDAAR